jgi:hypothetical protein
VPRAARQSRGLQQTKHCGDKKATCKKSYQSMRRQRFNIESLRHKKGCDKGKRGKEGNSAWHFIQTPFPRRKHFRLCCRIALCVHSSRHNQNRARLVIQNWCQYIECVRKGGVSTEQRAYAKGERGFNPEKTTHSGECPYLRNGPSPAGCAPVRTTFERLPTVNLQTSKVALTDYSNHPSSDPTT